MATNQLIRDLDLAVEVIVDGLGIFGGRHNHGEFGPR